MKYIVALGKKSMLKWRGVGHFPHATHAQHTLPRRHLDHKPHPSSKHFTSAYFHSIMAEALENTTRIRTRPTRRVNASDVYIFADSYLASHRRRHSQEWEIQLKSKRISLSIKEEVFGNCITPKWISLSIKEEVFGSCIAHQYLPAARVLWNYVAGTGTTWMVHHKRPSLLSC